jgi:hypothetical protein
MSTIQLPSEKEIRAAYQEGEEAVVLLFRSTFLMLAERIQQLEDQLAKNSRNSGKPPSSDGYDRRACGNVHVAEAEGRRVTKAKR